MLVITATMSTAIPVAMTTDTGCDSCGLPSHEIRDAVTTSDRNSCEQFGFKRININRSMSK